MPYDAEFRSIVLESISNLQGTGQLYNRKRHTLANVIDLYIAKVRDKHAMLGTVILERMSTHVIHIFNNVNSDTPFEVLDFIITVIKWYFRTLIKRRNRITPAVEQVLLPDYTIPEIKELYESMLV
jgi:hypothetical protein